MPSTPGPTGLLFYERWVGALDAGLKLYMPLGVSCENEGSGA